MREKGEEKSELEIAEEGARYEEWKSKLKKEKAKIRGEKNNKRKTKVKKC